MFSKFKTWLASVASWLGSAPKTDPHWFYDDLSSHLDKLGLTPAQRKTVNQLVLFGADYSRGSGRYGVFISLIDEEEPEVVVRVELTEKKGDIHTPLMEMHVLEDGSVDEFPCDLPIDPLLAAKMQMGARIKRD